MTDSLFPQFLLLRALYHFTQRWITQEQGLKCPQNEIQSTNSLRERLAAPSDTTLRISPSPWVMTIYEKWTKNGLCDVQCNCNREQDSDTCLRAAHEQCNAHEPRRRWRWHKCNPTEKKKSSNDTKVPRWMSHLELHRLSSFSFSVLVDISHISIRTVFMTDGKNLRSLQ